MTLPKLALLQRQTSRVFSIPTLLPPWALVVIAILSVQVGAAVAKQLFDAAGTSGVVFLRTLLGGLIFLSLGRPRLRGKSRKELGFVVLYGLNIAVMMLTFYAALNWLPLGVSVAIAFAGPLGLAVFTSRRVSDLLWALLAGAGVLMLSPFTNTELNPIGMVLALLSAVTWATYILLSKYVCHIFEGNDALTVGMLVAAVVALPFGIGGAVRVLADPSLILLTVVVALLSSAIPFGLEFQAIRQLPPRIYGLLVSLEPVVATLVGLVLLGEALGLREVVGILLVTVAAAATARSG